MNEKRASATRGASSGGVCARNNGANRVPSEAALHAIFFRSMLEPKPNGGAGKSNRRGGRLPL
jgi:hypothetical protein